MVEHFVLDIVSSAFGSVALGLSSLSFRHRAGPARVAWQQVKDKANGQLRIDPDDFYLTAKLHGTSVYARAEPTHLGPVTQITSKAVSEDGNLTISPVSRSDAALRALGMDSFQVGHPAFDKRFCVEADDEDLVRTWLTPETRQALLDAGSYRFRLVGGAVKARRSGVESDATALHGALRACALLARGPYVAMDAWNSLASSLEASHSNVETWQPGDDITLTLKTGGYRTVEALRCVARPGRQKPGIVTRIVAERRTLERNPYIMIATSAPQDIPVEGAVFEEGGVGWRIDGEPVPTELALPPGVSDQTRDLVREVNPAAVVAGEQSIALYLRGPVFDPLRIRYALELATALAGSPTLGAYR